MATERANLENTYRLHDGLVDTLPTLVRRQRRLAGQLAPLEALVDKDKACRQAIDKLLGAAGYTERGTGVTCLGYDVVHRGRDGHVSYDVKLLKAVLVERLVFLGMSRADIGTAPTAEQLEAAALAGKSVQQLEVELGYVAGAETFVDQAIAAVRSQGEPSAWAEVKPMKGAKVRRAA
jgi:hypothetical protein